MGRLASSEMSVPNTLCADGIKRAFRYYTRGSDRGFVRVEGMHVVGNITYGLDNRPRFNADPMGRNADLLAPTLPLERLIEGIKVIHAEALKVGCDVPPVLELCQYVGLVIETDTAGDTVLSLPDVIQQ